MALVKVYITLKKGIADPQGMIVSNALKNLGYDGVGEVRVGKYILLEIEGKDTQKIKEQVNSMCERLLANPIIEDYSFEVEN